MLGKQITTINEEIENAFQFYEGYNSCYYGKVRQGKTRTATADILELLKRGEIVYANWKIDFSVFDERESKMIVLMKFLFRKKYFYKYNSSNFHYIERNGLISGKGAISVHYLNRLVGVHVFIDEGQWVLPSLDRSFDEDVMAKMKLVLHGGHYCRSLNIITQRPQNISKNTRSQIHFWYRCEKRIDIGNFMLFQRWEIQDMVDDMPLEYDEEGDPVGSVKNYFVWKNTDEVFRSYNTHGMRDSDAIDVMPNFEVFELTKSEIFRTFVSLIFRRRRGFSPPPIKSKIGKKMT